MDLFWKEKLNRVYKLTGCMGRMEQEECGSEMGGKEIVSGDIA